MRIRFFTALMVLAFIAGQTYAQSKLAPKALTPNGVASVPATDFMWSLSCDGSKIAYLHAGKGLSILYLDGLKTIHLAEVFTPRANEEVTLMYTPHWSPYDPDELIFIIASSIDTSDVFPAISVENLYKYNLRTNVFENVTPPTKTEYGPTAISWGGWRYTSKPGSDSLLVGIHELFTLDGEYFYGYYVPQTQSFVKREIDRRLWSPHEEHFFEHRYLSSGSNIEVWPPTVDSILLNFPIPTLDTNRGIGTLGFSPNAELVLFEVWLLDSTGDQVRYLLISRCDDPAHPFLVLNPEEQFGMLSRGGMIPVFLTDSSIAISMHPAGATISPLWEVSIDGRLIRQLTRVPASVAENLRNGVPRVFVYGRTLRLNDLPQIAASVIELYSMTGQRVLYQTLGGSSSVAIDLPSLCKGVYAVVVRSGAAPLFRQLIQLD